MRLDHSDDTASAEARHHPIPDHRHSRDRRGGRTDRRGDRPVGLVRRELFTNLDNSLEQRADTYRDVLRRGGRQDLLLLLNSNDEDRAAQLVGPDGAVIASTPNLTQSRPSNRGRHKRLTDHPKHGSTCARGRRVPGSDPNNRGRLGDRRVTRRAEHRRSQ